MLRKNDLQRSQGQSQEMLRARCVMSGAVIRIDQHYQSFSHGHSHNCISGRLN
jgi:hypothetical protein